MGGRVEDGRDRSALAGLSEPEATRRLKEEGHNELSRRRPRGIRAIAFELIRQPMFLLLLSAGTIYLFLGDAREALMLLGFVFFVIGITVYQERKTERALERLKELSSPRALVIRGGQRKRIAGRDVVREDILVLAEGDRVPADAVLLSCAHFSADESLLTGESVPVRKTPWDGRMEMDRPGGEDRPFVYAGTLVVQGHGIARVKATGMQTEMGGIGKALESVDPEESPLQRETERVARVFGIVGLFLCLIVVIVYGLTRESWLNGLLAGITLAMALLPEEFPVVLTIFLSLGAWRISQHRVLTRRIPAIETLGSATVLCVDKTGTLTLNQMSVAQLFAREETCDLTRFADQLLPPSFHELVEVSILACPADSFDPIDRAIKQLGDRCPTSRLHEDWVRVREYPLSQTLLAMSHVWRSPGDHRQAIAAKGAPEAIGALCHFDREQTENLSRQIRSMARDGLRVVGVARADFHEDILPDDSRAFQYSFLGLIGLADPVRPAVPAAVKECYTAGIRVVMITGDYAATAQSIARQIGLRKTEETISGSELIQMGDLDLQRRIKSVNIFSRVMPEQKLRLVDALKANGEIVAMTGDGVNDAPALKSAHIGIAMGGRGTDVAREAASLVLLDDDFSSVVQAVKVGRRIFDNLRKAMAYIVGIHIPIAGLSLVPILLGWPLILLPVHIAFLHMVIDPAYSIIFESEPEEPDVMSRPPRDSKQPLFGRRILLVSALQGISVLLITLTVFSIALYRRQGEMDARALTFTTLIVANLSLIFTNRSWSRTIIDTLRTPNAALWWVPAGVVIFLAVVLYVPYLRDLFRFSRLHAIDLAISLAAGVTSILWFEGLKMLKRKRKPPHRE